MPAPRPRLFLIDGYSNIFRAFYAIRNLSNSRGQPTNAVYGFVTMLRKLLRDENPELIGVALDVSGKTVRSERYEDYKANRAPMPDDLRAQMPWVRQAIEAYRIPILEEPNYEADDVLGTLADKAAAAGYDVVLVSADKDLMQLVGPHVSLYHTGREKLYDEAAVAADFGVPPAQVVDVLALMGDAVDNVPGVPGIGDKGAKALIAEFGSLEALLERAGEVSRKAYREGLTEHADKARLSKELVTLHRDLPIELEPERLAHDPPDPEALRSLFTELEFYSLLDELGSAGGAELARAEEAEAPAAWRQRTAEAAGAVTLAAVGGEEPAGLAVAADGAIVFADFRRPGMREAALASLAGWIADPGRELVGHDVKELLRLAHRARGEGGAAPCRAPFFDTMLASYVLRPAAHGHSLEELAFERLGHKALTAKDAGWDRGHQPPPGDERLLAFAGERVALVERTAGPMRQELAAGGGALDRIYREIEEPLVPVLLAMEEAGVRLDVPYLGAMSTELAGELARLETEIYALAGETFNINSAQQLGTILFEKLSYPVLKHTRKTKSYSTSA